MDTGSAGVLVRGLCIVLVPTTVLVEPVTIWKSTLKRSVLATLCVCTLRKAILFPSAVLLGAIERKSRIPFSIGCISDSDRV